MLDKVCAHCHRTYRIEDVKVDRHWNSWSFEPAYCHCPYGNSILMNIYPDSVDLAKHLKPIYIIGFVGFFACFELGVATDTLGYIAPLMLLCFGTWLAKSSPLKDHRIIGLLLVALSVFVFVMSAWMKQA